MNIRFNAINGLAALVIAAFVMSGCTIRIVHEYKGAELKKNVPEATTTEQTEPVSMAKPAKVKTEVQKPVPPAERKADKITLDATRDTRFTHHSQELNRNSGKSNRLRVRGIERGSAELVAIDFDRTKLKNFVEKYEGQSFSGKLKLHVRDVLNGSAKVEVCTLDAGVNWKEGKGNLDKGKPGEATALEAQVGSKKWVTPQGQEVKQFKDLVYKKGQIVTVLNSAGVEIDGSGPVEIPLDEKFIRHYAVSPDVKGMVLFHRDNECKVDFFSKDQYGKVPTLVIETK